MADQRDNALQYAYNNKELFLKLTKKSWQFLPFQPKRRIDRIFSVRRNG